MLDGLRIMSKNLFGRAILAIFAGLIVVGFGFFGIRDVFTNFRADQLATIGDEEIGVQQYRGEYQNELQRLQRQAKRAVTNDEAREIGLDRRCCRAADRRRARPGRPKGWASPVRRRNRQDYQGRQEFRRPQRQVRPGSLR